MSDHTNSKNEEDPKNRFKRLISEQDIEDVQTPSDFENNNRALHDSISNEEDGLSSETVVVDTRSSEQPDDLDDTAPIKLDQSSQPNETIGLEKSEEPIPESIGFTPEKRLVHEDNDLGPPPNVIDGGTEPNLTQLSTARDTSPIYPRNSVTKKVEKNKSKGKTKKRFGCFFRASFFALFILVTVFLCALSIGLLQYYQIAASLPDISDLRNRASKFETTQILDRDGNVLYEILDPNAGRRTYVPLRRISPFLVAATVATEDKGFYSHPGFDPIAIGRAFLQNYQQKETVSGASTITQQLARALLFTQEERFEQSYGRKVREAVLAAEITRRYSKDEILELYLNEIYYGNLAYGVEAAAQTYFGTTADKLTLGQAAFLAGLPQAPAVYDVYTNPDVTFARLRDVLVLMFEDSEEQGCIYVSNNPQRICIDAVDITNAVVEIRGFNFKSPEIQIRAPHWVSYIRSILEEQYDPQMIYRAGFTVYTTLDPILQEEAEQAIRDHVKDLSGKNAKSGALVAIRPGTGEILAMAGSADYDNEDISGQVNMAISPRQPGSAIKPITYLAAFEKGWTPATLIWDVPSEFPPSGQPDDPRPPYKPVNYDEKFHGPVTVRKALANSYNVPAVKTLAEVGIYDDQNNPFEGGFLSLAQRLGITTLNRSDYGLSLTLGGGDVTLLELTDVYATLANNGRRYPHYAITKIQDHDGNLIFSHDASLGEQLLRPEHSYLITSILSDRDTRRSAFGTSSVLNLPFQSAAKTGTTNDFRDSLTLGYTPDVAVGVWVGNADYTPMIGVSGIQGAAPIWANFMEAAVSKITGGNPSSFSRPGGIVEREICAVSGTEPSKWCPERMIELFAADQPPLEKENDLWQKALIDTWTGLKASSACKDYIEEKFVLNVTDPWARRWIRKSPQGKAWAEEHRFDDEIAFAPERECTYEDPRPDLYFTSPRENEKIIESPLDIYGKGEATDWFDNIRLEFGIGEDPDHWELLTRGKLQIPDPEMLFSWDVDEITAGIITLRLFMESIEETYAQATLHIELQVPTPTPTPTDTPTPTTTFTTTPSSTPLPTATATKKPTNTSTPSPTIENTPLPTNTATETATPTPG